jgi:hypothetical protein
MGKLLTIDVSSFDPFMRKLSTMSADIQAEVDGELEAAAQKFARLAKNSLADQLGISAAKSLKGKKGSPTGRLMNATNYAKMSKPHSYKIFSNTNYAAYNEWGTITKVNVPGDLVELAILYKGRGIRKTGGMKAKHYFFSQRALVIPELIKNVKRVVNSKLSK